MFPKGISWCICFSLNIKIIHQHTEILEAWSEMQTSFSLRHHTKGFILGFI